MESKFLLLNALNESLVLNLWDFNEHRKDTLLGSATFELSKLVEDATHEDVMSHLLSDGKVRGELRYDLSWCPVLAAEEGNGHGKTCKLVSIASSLSNLSPFSCWNCPSYYTSSEGFRFFEIPGRGFESACKSLCWEGEDPWTYDPSLQAHQQSYLGVSV
jgi:hypothetical protein